jgi:hypothetical protein
MNQTDLLALTLIEHMTKLLSCTFRVTQ